jgi:hypothetical protein
MPRNYELFGQTPRVKNLTNKSADLIGTID